MGLFSDLSKMGLSSFDKKKVIEDKSKEAVANAVKAKAPVKVMTEKDYLLSREYDCPVCEWKFKSLSVKSGKARQTGQEIDMRIHYDGIDPVKYDVVSCPYCGYSAIASQFSNVLKRHIADLKEQVSMNFIPDDGWENVEEPYSYKQAIMRFKLALICAMVKKAKPSELAFISLKLHWLLEGYMETLSDDSEDYQKAKADNEECIKNACEGFTKAFSTENLPVFGLDDTTMPYLIAALNYLLGQYDTARMVVGRVITNRNASPRIKDKARSLKEMIDEKTGTSGLS